MRGSSAEVKDPAEMQAAAAARAGNLQQLVLSGADRWSGAVP